MLSEQLGVEGCRLEEARTFSASDGGLYGREGRGKFTAAELEVKN